MEAHELYLRASDHLRAGRDFEAMELLRSATVFEPNAQALVKLSELELEFGDPTASLAAASHAVYLAPSDPNALIAASCAIQRLDPSQASATWFRAALLSQDQGDKVRLLQAQTLIADGHLQSALTLLDGLIQRNPAWPAAYATLIHAKKIALDDRTLLTTIEALKPERNIDRIAIAYALGKAYDDLGDYERAMTQFDVANQLSRVGRFDPRAYAVEMAARRSTALKEARGSDSETPIFVLGMIRSGTTLAAQILSAHPDVVNAGELKHWINSDPRDNAARAIYERILAGFSRNGERVVDKQPGNILVAGQLQAAFPKARIIYMTRHPADTAISIWATQMQTSAPFVHDKPSIVFALREHEKLRDHWRSVIPSDRFLEVSYETLVTDRESETRRMVEFCGLPWSDECLAPEAARSSVATPSVWQVRQPIYSSSIGRWRNYRPWLGAFEELV